MDDQDATGRDPRRPASVVGAGRLDTVATVDEQQAQRRLPPPRHGGRRADDGDHPVLQTGPGDVLAEHPERVHEPELGVDRLGVVVLPAGLVLL